MPPKKKAWGRRHVGRACLTRSFLGTFRCSAVCWPIHVSSLKGPTGPKRDSKGAPAVCHAPGLLSFRIVSWCIISEPSGSCQRCGASSYAELGSLHMRICPKFVLKKSRLMLTPDQQTPVYQYGGAAGLSGESDPLSECSTPILTNRVY